MVTSRLGKLWEAWGDLCERSFSGEGVGEQPVENTYTAPPDPEKGSTEILSNLTGDSENTAIILRYA